MAHTHTNTLTHIMYRSRMWRRWIAYCCYTSNGDANGLLPNSIVLGNFFNEWINLFVKTDRKRNFKIIGSQFLVCALSKGYTNTFVGISHTIWNCRVATAPAIQCEQKNQTAVQWMHQQHQNQKRTNERNGECVNQESGYPFFLFLRFVFIAVLSTHKIHCTICVFLYKHFHLFIVMCVCVCWCLQFDLSEK